ncbi:hypothetical protein [Mycetocola lacteus]|nr:hypothetical protein [Mycetocola lacteus]
MNERLRRRRDLGLSQAGAARRASVSVSTWARWEVDPERVKESTGVACARVLGLAERTPEVRQRDQDTLEWKWLGGGFLTPKQAQVLVAILEAWANQDIARWLLAPGQRPLFQVPPFAYFDVRVMFRIAENRAFADAVARACRGIVNELKRGTVPFYSPGPYIDELLMGAAVREAITRGISALDDSGLYRPRRWEDIAAQFTKRSYWNGAGPGPEGLEWDIPISPGHRQVSELLDARPPWTWFDHSDEIIVKFDDL